MARHTDDIMREFLTLRDQRPEMLALESDPDTRTREGCVRAQGLADATDILAKVLWPWLDTAARIAHVMDLEHELQVAASATPRFNR